MGFMTIDRIWVEFMDEPNVLSVIRKADIDTPTLCYHSELSIYGACRSCTMENERGETFTSCSEPPGGGMAICINTPRLMKYRRMMLELLFAVHCRDYTTCIESRGCRLQELAHHMGTTHVSYENTRTQYPINIGSSAIVKDLNKCILCSDCIRMCDNTQSVNAIDFAYRGTEALVTPVFNKNITETDRVSCGQYRTVCPTGAISININIEVIWEALAGPSTKVVVQVAPAVRVAVEDSFGVARGENMMGKIVNVLHRMGFDEVFDTAYGTDLAVTGESREFLEWLISGKSPPLSTSCHPAWVSFCENWYPEFRQNLSTYRSSQQMFGAVIQEYYRNPQKSSGKELLSVSIMPYIAKKAEILQEEFKTDGKADVDYVLTTTELVTMVGKSGIRFENIDTKSSNMPFGIGSGAGVIFGNTGGIMEAVLHRLYGGHGRAEMDQIRYGGVRGEEGLKGITYDCNGRKIRAAVVSGLANVDMLMKRIGNGEAEYDFVGIMTCRGGCIMGDDQPVPAGSRTKAAKAKGLYDTNINTQIEKSNEDPLMFSLYENLLEEREHKLLHRSMVMGGIQGQKDSVTFRPDQVAADGKKMRNVLCL